MRRISIVCLVLFSGIFLLSCQKLKNLQKQDVQVLIDDFDNISKEYCNYINKCYKTPESSFEVNLEQCIKSTQLSVKQFMTMFPSCPDWGSSSLIMNYKCTLDIYKKYGESACPPGFATTYRDEYVECLQSYDLTKQNECYCEHFEEMVKDSKYQEEIREACRNGDYTMLSFKQDLKAFINH